MAKETTSTGGVLGFLRKDLGWVHTLLGTILVIAGFGIKFYFVDFRDMKKEVERLTAAQTLREQTLKKMEKESEKLRESIFYLNCKLNHNGEVDPVRMTCRTPNGEIDRFDPDE